MKVRSALSVFTILPLLISSCDTRVIRGNSEAKTEDRHLASTSFNRIEINAPVDAHITIGGSPSMELDGPSNILPYIRSEVRNNTLRIFTDENTHLETRNNVSATINLPELRGIDVSGAGNHDIVGIINSEEFSLESSGASKLKIADLQVRNMSVELSGASNVNIGNGSVEHGSYDISGSGNIRAYGVTHHSAEFDISGAATAELTVTDNLDADISGAGSVRYKGHPQIRKDVSGVGHIVDAN